MTTSLRNIVILQIIAILFAMLNLSNIKIEYVANFLPLFDVMIIYYFAVLRPQVFAVWFLFLLGLIGDSINGFPLGITSLSYILTVKLFNSLNQRILVKENFQQIFGQFIAFAFIILFLKWAMLSIYHFKNYNFVNPMIQLVITATLYVLLHKFFDYLDKKLLQNI
ncbi:MAG: rod shape-determining protein MreD [Pseudomonadota bacterium]